MSPTLYPDDWEEQAPDIRDWPGWNLVALLVLFLVLAIVVRACCG